MADTVELLSRRDMALLHAAADGRCHLVPGAAPVLFVDRWACCDSDAGRRLIHAGMLAAPDPGAVSAPAELTPAGLAVLATAHA